MCRHLARIGPAATLADVLITPPYSLQMQAYAPRMQTHGLINADGFGVGWYVAGRREPVRFRRAQPMWSDVSFASIAEAIPAQCLLAAVRSATPGFPVEESATAPFMDGPWLFSHNGRVEDFAQAADKLHDRGAVAPDARAAVDSALLFALALTRWRAGESLAAGLAGVVSDVLAVTTGRLNLLATDGERLAATVWGESLFLHESGAGDERAVVIASEPYDDDPGWTPIPDRSLVTADLYGTTVEPLTLESS